MTPKKTRIPKKAQVLAFCLASAIIAAAGSLTAGLSRAAPRVSHEKVRVIAKRLTGLYSRKDGSDLSILAHPGGKLDFGIQAIGFNFGTAREPAPSTGDLYGTITLKGSHAEYQDGDCHVSFQFTGSSAILSQRGSDMNFGQGVDITGVYYKKNSQVPKPGMLKPDN